MSESIQTIQNVLQQSSVLSPQDKAMFVEYAQAQSSDVQESIAEALESDAGKFIRDMDSAIGPLQRATRTRNFPLFEKYLNRMVKKVVYAEARIDEEAGIVDTKKRIQEIYGD